MPPRARTVMSAPISEALGEDHAAEQAAEAEAADTAALEVLELQQRLESTERELGGVRM